MAGVLTAFIASLVICCVIAYLLGLFWFSDVRNRRYRSFFLLGIEVFIWTLLNAITMVCDVQYFPVIYSLRMVMVCIVPFGAAWFILDFAGSRLVRKKWVLGVFIALPALDVLCMLTNPLHHLYFLNYNYPVPARALLFWVHTAVDFLFIIFAFVVLIRFIIKGARSNPVLILTGVAMLVPYSLNLLYSFGLIPFPHDTTPIGFFVTLILFIFAAYRLQLFNIKTALLSTTMDSIADVIILFGKNRLVADVNRQARESFSDFTLKLGRTRLEHFCDYLRSRAIDEEPEGLIADILRSGEATGECTVRLPGGSWRTYTLAWQAVVQRNRLAGYILMLTDVSSYKEMIGEINQQNRKLVELKEEAEAASRAKGEFLSRMSHEMRTPMNAIIGMTQVALKKEDLTDDVQQPLEKIQGASNHLLGVINDVLDMAKIESGKFALSAGEYTLEALLKNVSVVVDIYTAQKQQHFEVVLADDLPPAVRIDSQRLTQVITNLLSNAFKFSPVGGHVSLSITLEARQGSAVRLRFEVQDDGIGLSAEQQARLFTPFEQADGSISRNYGGTGLGLAISKTIVEMMGGEIWVRSTLGAGACFGFTVNAETVEAWPAAADDTPAPPVAFIRRSSVVPRCAGSRRSTTLAIDAAAALAARVRDSKEICKKVLRNCEVVADRWPRGTRRHWHRPRLGRWPARRAPPRALRHGAPGDGQGCRRAGRAQPPRRPDRAV